MLVYDGLIAVLAARKVPHARRHPSFSYHFPIEGNSTTVPDQTELISYFWNINCGKRLRDAD